MQALHDTGRLIYTKNGVPEFKRYLDESEGIPIQSVWADINPVNSQATEDTGYDTQKPESLVERIVLTSSNEGDIVADFFCGSGTTLAVAEKLNRRWIGCDLGRFAIHTTRKRLLGIPDCKPFEILNLGRYERKYWQGVTFGDEKPAEPNQAAVAAYVRFILDLYHAQPLPGTHIHGRKAGALVHVGAVDAPVTIGQINAALAEAAELRQIELHVLGWEWEMGMSDPVVQQAKQTHGVRLRLLNIPREVMERQAVDRGDVRFFDLAHLEAEIVNSPITPAPPPRGARGQKVKVRLTDFVIPDTDLIPDEVRAKIRKWSDYIDYWAVDWDFRHDTFMNQWQAYRTRKVRKLDLESAEHEYSDAGHLPGPGEGGGHLRQRHQPSPHLGGPVTGRPHVFVIAGPNGAGKSTAAPALLRDLLGVAEYVNADLIAQGLSAFDTQSVAFQAGRVMLERLRQLAARRRHFAFETTLATRGYLPWLRSLRTDGFELDLAFLWLPSPEMAVARVAERVRRGGHDVPEAVIRRRYERGLDNFFRLYRPIADRWWLFGNATEDAPRLIARGSTGTATEIHDGQVWNQLSERYP